MWRSSRRRPPPAKPRPPQPPWPTLVFSSRSLLVFWGSLRLRPALLDGTAVLPIQGQANWHSTHFQSHLLLLLQVLPYGHELAAHIQVDDVSSERTHVHDVTDPAGQRALVRARPLVDADHPDLLGSHRDGGV